MVLCLSGLLQSLDEEFDNKILLLVSHGDPLLVLLAVCSGVNAGLTCKISPTAMLGIVFGSKYCLIYSMEPVG